MNRLPPARSCVSIRIRDFRQDFQNEIAKLSFRTNTPIVELAVSESSASPMNVVLCKFDRSHYGRVLVECNSLDREAVETLIGEIGKLSSIENNPAGNLN
jgi:hypothetical protein